MTSSSSSDKPDKNPDLDLAMSLQHEYQCSDEDNSESDEELDEEDEEFDYEQELGFLEEGGDESEMDEDEIDPEELMELGEPIGSAEDRGLSKDKIPLCLCPTNYRAVITGVTDQCVVCQTEYEEGEPVVGLVSCTHVYHAECITPWLRVKKTCPVCNMEISPPPTVEDVAKTKI